MIETLFQVKNWTYQVAPVEEAVPAFAEASEFFELWTKKRGGRTMPCWADFAPPDFKSWLGWILVEQIVQQNPLKLRFRLFGTQLTRLFGDDLTGLEPDELEAQFFWPEDLLFRRHIMENACVGAAWGPVAWNDRSFRNFAYYCTPVADEFGRPDKFLHLIREHHD